MIAIISDIHGNYPALKAVLDDIDKKGIEKIFCLGDSAGYYSMINECIEVLIEREVYSLRGNHDYYLTSGVGCHRSNSANRCIDFQKEKIKTSNRIWLENLNSSSLIIDDLHLVHGGWNDELDEYLSNISEDYFENIEGKYLFSGHTHVPIVYNMADKVYCNPGAVGQPRDGNPKASYAIFNSGIPRIVRVSYDIDIIAHNMRKNGFDEYFYKNLYTGRKIGGELSSTIITI